MTRMTRARIWATGLGLIVILAIVLFSPEFIGRAHHLDVPVDGTFPPAFSGNRAEYAFALFSLFAMSSLAIRKLIVISAQLSARDWREEPDVGLYRMAVAALMLVIVLGAAPDVALMLLWGEVSAGTIELTMTVNRLCDGLTILPFLFAVAVYVRAEQLEIVPLASFARGFELASPPRRALYLVVPRNEALVDYVRIVVSAVVIALGLALFK